MYLENTSDIEMSAYFTDTGNSAAGGLLTLSLLRLLDSNFLGFPYGPGNSTPYNSDYA